MRDFARRLRLIMRSKVVQSSILAVLVIAMLGASESRFDRLGHEMVCMCGCNQILNECNHVGCPVSPVMLDELRQQLAGGGTDTAVLNWFAAKYGAIVLAAPIRGGFDNVAWITPLAVFVLATAGTAFTVWAWRKRTLRLSPASAHSHADTFATDNAVDPAQQALRDRIRQETEYR
jgi:cytochrome c-type biogenesis protein CcmH/NrfF